MLPKIMKGTSRYAFKFLPCMAQVKSIYFKLTLMAEVTSSVVNNLPDFRFHIFSHFLRIIIFHESPNGFYSDTHHKSSLYFNFSRKVLSPPYQTQRHIFEELFTESCRVQRTWWPVPRASQKLPPTRVPSALVQGLLMCHRHRHQFLFLAKERYTWCPATNDTSTVRLTHPFVSPLSKITPRQHYVS